MLSEAKEKKGKHKEGCSFKYVDIGVYANFEQLLVDGYGLTWRDSLNNEEINIEFKYCPVCGVEL